MAKVESIVCSHDLNDGIDFYFKLRDSGYTSDLTVLNHSGNRYPIGVFDWSNIDTFQACFNTISMMYGIAEKIPGWSNEQPIPETYIPQFEELFKTMADSVVATLDTDKADIALEGFDKVIYGIYQIHPYTNTMKEGIIGPISSGYGQGTK